jgi:glycosyltransferase involved in cell wall biosynthesis
MASACIAISRNEIEHFTSYNISRNKIRVIPNGVDPADFQFRDDKTFRQKYAIGDGPFILFVGRLNHIKGPDLLIRAFSLAQKNFENLQLVLAGPDEGFKAKLIQIINKLHLSRRIHFIGYVGGKDKSFAYHAADLLVIPSRQEAMSIVVLEAGMCGTPVVLTDRCGFNAVEEVSGGKVVPATVDGLAQGIQNVLSRSTNNGLFGANLRNFVKKHFIWDVIVQNYVDLYKTILFCETA